MPVHSETSQPDVPQGRLSPRNYAPHLDDPDPPEKPMPPIQLELMGQRTKALMQAKGLLKK
jgi:hypothetical protein